MDPWNSASGGFAYIWQSKWVRIIAIKNEGTEIHFLSDALVVVASLDLKVPILAGKRGSRRHSTTSFSKNVVVAGTSYEMLEVLAFCNWERAQPPSITITVLTFLVKKRTSGCLFFDNTRKNFKSNLVLVVVLVLESKVLYWLLSTYVHHSSLYK